MFRAPLCPSSGAREYYTGGCCLSYLVLCFSSCRYGVELRVVCRFAGCCLKTWKPSTKYVSNHLYNTLELLMMSITVPETCWASNKICNKNSSVASSWHFIPHIIDDARSKPHQISYYIRVDIHFIFCLLYALYTCLVFRTFLCNYREWRLVFTTMDVQREGKQAGR